jgi:hypothetical protein
MLVSWVRDRAHLRGRKAHESMRPGPELILQGATNGHCFLGGRKPLERRWKAREGFSGKRQSGKAGSKGPADHGEGTKLCRAKPKSVGG